MFKDRIIELNDGKSYYVLEELSVDNKKYICCTLCDVGNESVDQNNFVIVELKVDQDKYVLLDIDNDEEIVVVTNFFLYKMKKN